MLIIIIITDLKKKFKFFIIHDPREHIHGHDKIIEVDLILVPTMLKSLVFNLCGRSESFGECLHQCLRGWIQSEDFIDEFLELLLGDQMLKCLILYLKLFRHDPYVFRIELGMKQLNFPIRGPITDTIVFHNIQSLIGKRRFPI